MSVTKFYLFFLMILYLSMSSHITLASPLPQNYYDFFCSSQQLLMPTEEECKQGTVIESYGHTDPEVPIFGERGKPDIKIKTRTYIGNRLEGTSLVNGCVSQQKFIKQFGIHYTGKGAFPWSFLVNPLPEKRLFQGLYTVINKDLSINNKVNASAIFSGNQNRILIGKDKASIKTILYPLKHPFTVDIDDLGKRKKKFKHYCDPVLKTKIGKVRLPLSYSTFRELTVKKSNFETLVIQSCNIDKKTNMSKHCQQNSYFTSSKKFKFNNIVIAETGFGASLSGYTILIDSRGNIALPTIRLKKICYNSDLKARSDRIYTFMCRRYQSLIKAK